MKKLVLFLSICLAIYVLPSYAVEYAIKNPSQVGAFKLCFANNDPEIRNAAQWPVAVQNSQHAQIFLTAEQLKNMPFCVTQNLTVSEYHTLTTFEKDFFVAVSEWQSYFKNTDPVRITMVPNLVLRGEGGGMVPGQQTLRTVTRRNGDHVSVRVVEPRALDTMSGIETQSDSPSDIVISLNPNVLRAKTKEFCFDQNPTGANIVCQNPMGRDLPSVMLHELGHGYGITSARIRSQKARVSYGDFFRRGRIARVSALDFQTNNSAERPGEFLLSYKNYFSPNGGHPILFTGPITVAYLHQQAYQSPSADEYGVAMTNAIVDGKDSTQNFSHFLNPNECQNKAFPLPQPLMGLWCRWKHPSRLAVDTLTLSVLADEGYAPYMRTTTAVPNLQATLFNPLTVTSSPSN
jgi:hypothetical protein